MRVSIIICTYSMKLLPYLEKAVRSLILQKYNDIQIIIVVDGNSNLYQSIQNKKNEEWKNFTPKREIIVMGHKKNRGLSYSRNKGIKKADGEVIAFFDDDAVADAMWISTIIETYQKENAIAVGGKILPIWEVERPKFLPEECFWLIGVTHKGFAEDYSEVRNTFGSNISFKSDVFNKIGKFYSKLGKKGEKQLQGEETELAMRMKSKMKRGVFYNPEAIVYHHVFQKRVNMFTLLKRSFEQGRSKGILSKIARQKDYSMDNENEYANYLLSKSMPEKLKGIFKMKNGKKELYQLSFISLCVGLVGLGYFSILVRSKWV